MGKSTGLPRGVEINGKKLRVSFQYRGRRCREQLDLEVSPTNIKAASRMREKIVMEIEAGIFEYGKYFEGKGDITGQTFGDLATIWLGARKAELAKATYVKYDQCLNQFWLPEFGDRNLVHLKPSEVLMVIGKIDWSTLSPKRRNDALIPLRGVFQMAMDEGLITIDPLARVKNKRPTPRQANPFNMKEVETVLAEMPTSVKPIYEVLFFTGMRPGELIELKWSDIDLAANQIGISRNRTLGEVGDTKTHKPRTHEMADRVRTALEGLGHRKGHVFINPNTGKAFHEVRPIREEWWTTTLKAAEIEYRELYQTRHTYATLAIAAGANPYWIAQQMGTSPELIYRVYSKWLKGNSDGNKVNALISS